MNEHDHKHPPQTPAPVAPDDSGSQALSDALRSSFVIVRFLMVALALVFLCSGFFSVGPQEKAVILRFGKPVGEGDKALLDPGFHVAFPRPIDEVVKIPITEVQTATSTIGWYAVTPEQEAARTEPPPGPSLNPAIDGYVLTGDANVIHVRARLRYRVADPVRYHFGFTRAAALVTNALNEAVVFASARFNVDDVLTRDVTGFRDTIYRRMLELADAQQLGIEIEPPTIEQIAPRQEPVHSSFSRVLDATIQREKQMNQALQYQGDLLSRARSNAGSITNAALAEKVRTVEFVAAQSKRFSDLLPKYEQSPELFMKLWQTDALRRVMTNAQDKVFVSQRPDGKSRELRMHLSRELPKSTLPENPK